MAEAETVAVDRRKSVQNGRRRSSFAPGRISLLAKDVAEKDDMYKQIPADCAAGDRLCQLVRHGLWRTLDQMEKEMGDVPGFELFREEALKNIEGTINTMETNGTFEKACENLGTVPNPINFQMNATIAELTRSIHRMEKEDKEWDSLLQRLEQQAKDAEKQLSQLEVEADDLPADVKELAETYLTGLPDLEDTLTSVQKDVKTVSLAMDEYRQTVSLLKMVQQSAQYHYTNAANTLNGETHSIVSNPSHIIKRMVSIDK